MLTVEKAAQHFGLAPATVRRRIKSGDLHASQVNRSYRLEWADIWACEQGPTPRGLTRKRYEQPLIGKPELAQACGFSVRTIERWIADGLPTRNVFGVVRMNPSDARDWLAQQFGLELSVERLADVAA